MENKIIIILLVVLLVIILVGIFKDFSEDEYERFGMRGLGFLSGRYFKTELINYLEKISVEEWGKLEFNSQIENGKLVVVVEKKEV